MSPVQRTTRRLRAGVTAVLVAALLPAAAVVSTSGAVARAAAPAPAVPAAHWAFDEGTGSTAADPVGGHTATLQGGAGWGTPVVGASALAGNGSTAYADAGSAVIDPTKSFSVSTWVKLNRVNGFQTVVSIDGDQVSNFFLGFRDDTRRFAFVRLPSDAPAGAPAFPSSTFDPVANQWYQLTGVYDSVANTTSLYVNGVLQATVSAPPAWAPTGHLVIGRGKFGGNPVDFVDGTIDDVRVWTGALQSGDVARLASNGSWPLDEGTGTTTADTSPNGYTGTLTGGAAWTAGVVGAHAVALNGTSAFIDTPATVVDTTQSFSVAAWVRADAAGFRTAVSVDGAQVSGFYLQERGDTGKFAFAKLAADASDNTGAAVASSTDPVTLGQWYQLLGVYDSAAATVSLYVDGALQSTVAAPAAWKASGHLVIGRGKFGGNPSDFWSGAVDDVRTYPFPLGATDAQALATSGEWHFDEGSGTTARDSSPDAADGTLRGATWTKGAAGNAVALDGSSDVTMGTAPGLNLGTASFSLATWFRTASPASQTIVAKGSADGYGLGITAGRLTAHVGAIVVSTTGSSLADGAWHHVALVVDRTAGTLRLYVDGTPAAVTVAGCGTATGTTVDISACASQAADSAAAFTVGSVDGNGPKLVGAVDELSLDRFVLTAAQVAKAAGYSTLAVDAADVRATTHSTEYGAILEDISHSVEGGLYAELVRNRAFKEDGTGPVPYWSLSTTGGATASFAIDKTTALNSANPLSLQVSLANLPAGGSASVANTGFYGVAVDPSTTYKGSLWAKASTGFTGVTHVSLVKNDGTVLATKALPAIRSGWTHLSYTLRTPSGIAHSTDNKVVVSFTACAKKCAAVTGKTVWLQEVSLFPPTFDNRPNGLRPDLMSKLKAMHLGLFRIPGGNYLEGNTLDTRFNWKNTLGPIENRPGHQNTAWGYWSTDGMGIEEYLQMTEDVGAQPLLAVFAGYTLNGQHVAQADYGQYVQDALDEIQYAIGDTSTTWGAKRAAAGHPAPFKLNYVEIGNEDFFDQSGSYEWRFSEMYDAIKAAYPQLRIVATTPVSSRTPDVVDEHYYQSPQWFVDNAHRYDKNDRSGPKILVGEYGSLEGNPTGDLRAAVGEAAFLTGLERNSDIVVGGMYAPILVHENAPNWPTNMLGFDAGSSYGSPSYWVQRMFSNNLGKSVVGSQLSTGSALAQDATVTRAKGVTTVYVKVVNPSDQLQTAAVRLTGLTSVDGTATRTVLTGDPAARNTLAAPLTVSPTTSNVSGVTAATKFSFPANSVTVLRFTGTPDLSAALAQHVS